VLPNSISRSAVRMDYLSPHHIGSQTSPGNIAAALVRLNGAARGWQDQARHPLDRLDPRRGRQKPGSQAGIRRGRALRPAPRVRPPAGATDAGGSPHYSRALACREALFLPVEAALRKPHPFLVRRVTHCRAAVPQTACPRPTSRETTMRVCLTCGPRRAVCARRRG